NTSSEGRWPEFARAGLLTGRRGGPVYNRSRRKMIQSPPSRSFVPQDLDVADFAQLEPLYTTLLDRPVDAPRQLEQLHVVVSELTAVFDEYGSRRYIDKSCHTDDERIERAYLHFVENVEPRVKPLFFRLQKKFMDSPARGRLTDRRYRMLERLWGPD